MEGKSLDIKQNNIETLRKLFPHIFSEDKIDLEKFQAAFAENINFHNERYTLNWAGKSDAFKILQEGTTATLKPQPELSVNFDTTENVFIEGENLETLKVLQKSYYSKIKCIIIDPPYNTGSDSFIYPDRFKENLDDYEKRIGERDEEGYLMKEGLFRKNSKENGHYHSNWLNMMLPRLFLARNLLRDDGVIFVHIDDNEVHNLRLLMNEIFGEENFVADFIWKKKGGSGNTEKIIGNIIEYIVCYAKRSEKGIFNYRNLEREYKFADEIGKYNLEGIEKTNEGIYERKTMQFAIIDPATKKEFYPQEGKRWTIGEKTANEYIEQKKLLFDYGKSVVKRIKRPEDYELSENVFLNLLLEHGSLATAKDELLELIESREAFDTPKPTILIKQLLQIATGPDSIILDFFAGSGTTGHAVLDLNKEDGGNRRFILVQLPELCDENSEAYRAGYKTIADISRERIRRAIKLCHPMLDHPLPPPKEGNLQQERQMQQNSPPPEGGRNSGGVVASPSATSGVLGLRNTQNYMALPYNPKLKERAKELRKAGNLSEVLFWNKVKNKQFKNFDFDRQKIIGNYIADFYCSNCNVVIEIDGSSHNDKQEYDAARDEYLKGLGLEVIHITDADIKENIDAVMEMLHKHHALRQPIDARPPLTPPKEGNLQQERQMQQNSPPPEGCRDSGGVVGFRSYKLSPSNFKVWCSEEITEENLEQQMEMFIDPVKPESQTENMLVELMLKSGYLLTDKVENRGNFYYINNELVIALTKIDLEIATEIIELKPQKAITLDRLFAGNDELKTNTALQMRDAGVELRVV